MLRDVRYCRLARRLAQESEMTNACRGKFRFAALSAILIAAFFASSARAAGIALPPKAIQALDKIYSGDPDAAIALAHEIEQAQPDHPLGFLIESEAKWWKRYCVACEIKYGILEAWKKTRDPDDAAYLALTGKVTTLAEAQLAKSDTAEMHTFAGLGWALQVRVYALRGENRAAAHAGVSARTEMLTALKLDPGMADATAALGIYNYYVDTLSPIVKLLRIFMGIPGGDKQTGIKQMQIGMNQGSFLAVDIRFILARSLRTYDQKYEEALSDAEPLLARYPQNPIFMVLLGNLNVELGRNAKASEYFHAAQKTSIPDSACAARMRELAGSFLSSLN
jgi:tetratricopeptide (TPR) repeat protein